MSEYLDLLYHCPHLLGLLASVSFSVFCAIVLGLFAICCIRARGVDKDPYIFGMVAAGGAMILAIITIFGNTEGFDRCSEEQLSHVLTINKNNTTSIPSTMEFLKDGSFTVNEYHYIKYKYGDIESHKTKIEILENIKQTTKGYLDVN